MSRRTARHSSGGRTGQHYKAGPTDLRTYAIPPAGPVTSIKPNGDVMVSPAKAAIVSDSKIRKAPPRKPADAGSKGLRGGVDPGTAAGNRHIPPQGSRPVAGPSATRPGRRPRDIETTSSELARSGEVPSPAAIAPASILQPAARRSSTGLPWEDRSIPRRVRVDDGL
jgi:hypothetical protein